MPSAMVLTQDQAGPDFFAPSKQIMFSGLPVDHRDVVQFISPIQGLLFTSPNAVLTSLKLEGARLRSAANSLPNGVLRQVGGEPLSGEELQQLSQSFEAARLTNTVAALNEFVTYTETTTDPSKQMLVEASEYQALEIARLANCPPYLLGVATGSYSYQNSTQARQDLYMFGAKLFMDCISETLSADNVLPRGTYVKFDIDDYLSENYLMEKENENYDTAETGVMPNA
jgi:phage portal protein BeeE